MTHHFTGTAVVKGVNTGRAGSSGSYRQLTRDDVDVTWHSRVCRNPDMIKPKTLPTLASFVLKTDFIHRCRHHQTSRQSLLEMFLV